MTEITEDDIMIWKDKAGYWEIKIPLNDNWIIEKVTGEQLKQQILQALELKKRIEKYVSDLEANLGTTISNDYGIKTKGIKEYKEMHKWLEPVLKELQQLLGDKK